MTFHRRSSAKAVHFFEGGAVFCGTPIALASFRGGGTTTHPDDVTCANCVRALVARVCTDLLALSPGEIPERLRSELLAELLRERSGWVKWRLRKARRKV